MKWKWKSLSCVGLCDPMDHTVHGILLARILESVAFPLSRGSSQPRDWNQVSHIARGFFTSWATREAQEYWRGSLSLLQRIFPTQESNQGLLHCRQILYQMRYLGSPLEPQSYINHLRLSAHLAFPLSFRYLYMHFIILDLTYAHGQHHCQIFLTRSLEHTFLSKKITFYITLHWTTLVCIHTSKYISSCVCVRMYIYMCVCVCVCVRICRKMLN